MIGRLWSGSRFFEPAKAELHPQRNQDRRLCHRNRHVGGGYLSPTFATQRKKRQISGFSRLRSRISKGSLVEMSV